jgi:hypothetical protein
MRTVRGGEAAGLWHGRDSTRFRWRGRAGPMLVAWRRRCAPSERKARQQTIVNLAGGGGEVVGGW